MLGRLWEQDQVSALTELAILVGVATQTNREQIYKQGGSDHDRCRERNKYDA